MKFESIKHRFIQKKKRDVVVVLTSEKKNEELTESLNIHSVDVEYIHIKSNKLNEYIEGNINTRLCFIIDELSYEASELNNISMLLRGKFDSILLGVSNTLDASWKAEELGFSFYHVRCTEYSRLVKYILKSFGHIRSRTSMVISLCNVSPDIRLSYRAFSELRKSDILKTYSVLFVDLDISNIYYDADLGVKVNSALMSYIMEDGVEFDGVSSTKLIYSIDERFDYVSFNLLVDDIDNINRVDIHEVLDRVNVLIDSVSDKYGFIFVNVPYYLLCFNETISILNASDNRTILTDHKIESVYNINYIQNKIKFKSKDFKNKDKLICFHDAEHTTQRITNSDIEKRLGLNVDCSVLLKPRTSVFSVFNKKDDDLVKAIFG